MERSVNGKQAWVVSLTFFDRDGAVDEAAMRAHVRRLRDAGQGVYVGSTNIGEGFALGEDELLHLLKITVDELGGRGVRAAGIEARSITEATRMVRLAERAGVDAVHVFQLDTGHGSSKPDATELERYYTRVIERAAVPIVLSNYPSLGYTVPVEVIGRLLDRFPQIISVRDASGDLGYFAELVARFAGRAELYAVGVRSLPTVLLLGADGVLTTEANIAPRLVRSVLDLFERSDIPAMTQAYQLLVRLHRLLVRHGGSAGRGMKPLLEHLGAPGGALRAPRSVPQDLDALFTGFAALDVAEWQAVPA